MKFLRSFIPLILQFVPLENLLSWAMAMEDVWEAMADKTARRILDEGLSDSATATNNREQYPKDIQERIRQKVAEKAAEDSLSDALSCTVATVVSQKWLGLYYRTATYLDDLSRSPQVIAKLKGLHLELNSIQQLDSVRKIHEMNPDIRWHIIMNSINYAIEDMALFGAMKMTLAVPLRNHDELQQTQKLCDKSRSGLLKLELDVVITVVSGRDAYLHEVLDCTPIMQHLAQLETTVYEEHEFRALDAARREYAFDTVLNVAQSCHLLRGSSHVPSSLVELEMDTPTAAELSWLMQEAGKPGISPRPQLIIENVEYVQMLSILTHSYWSLAYVSIVEHLSSETDVSLFRQLYIAHAGMSFKMVLENADLLRFLLRHEPPGYLSVTQFEDGMFMCTGVYERYVPSEDLYDHRHRHHHHDCDSATTRRISRHRQVQDATLDVSCDPTFLPQLLDMDLSRVNDFAVFLADEEIDYASLATVFRKCPSLKILGLWDYREESSDFGALPGVVQEAFDQYWPHIENLLIYSQERHFFELDLPGFIKNTTGSFRAWTRSAT